MVGCGADHAPGDPALRRDHERAGEGGDGDQPVELKRDAVARIAQAWIAKPVVLHVGPGAGGVVSDVDADEADARWGEPPGGDRQRRCFLLADRAP